MFMLSLSPRSVEYNHGRVLHTLHFLQGQAEILTHSYITQKWHEVPTQSHMIQFVAPHWYNRNSLN